MDYYQYRERERLWQDEDYNHVKKLVILNAKIGSISG